MGTLDERRAQFRNDSEHRVVVTRAGVRYVDEMTRQ